MAVKHKIDMYAKVASHEGVKGAVKKVVLLYSGGFDTTTMIPWIREEYKAEVITLTLDIGQKNQDLEAIRQKALRLGAVKALVVDVRTEFAEDYIARSIKANGMYQGRYYLSTSLCRPLLAQWAVKVADQEGADAIAHGASGKGNDQVRLEGSALALNPDIKIIAPAREWGMSREQQIEYAHQHDIPFKKTQTPYTYDDNLWGIIAHGEEIENPALIPPLENILQLCSVPEKALDAPEYVTIAFDKGVPTAIDGVTLPLVKIIEHLNQRAAPHAVGITHLVGDRIIGLKVRGLCEAPAAETIVTAHQALERYTSTQHENEFKTIVDEKWTYLCYGALWFEPLMTDLNAYQDKANETVTGTVTVKLYKGHVEAVAMETPHSVFDDKQADFMESSALFNQQSSAGFIEHYTLQMKMAQRRQRTALLSVGGRVQKLKLLPQMRALEAQGYHLYATYKTYKFLKARGIEATLVHKISSSEHKPNVNDLLDANRFDLIMNIPTTPDPTEVKAKEKADSRIIREKAVQSNTPLITSVSVAVEVVARLSKAKL